MKHIMEGTIESDGIKYQLVGDDVLKITQGNSSRNYSVAKLLTIIELLEKIREVGNECKD